MTYWQAVVLDVNLRRDSHSFQLMSEKVRGHDTWMVPQSESLAKFEADG